MFQPTWIFLRYFIDIINKKITFEWKNNTIGYKN